MLALLLAAVLSCAAQEAPAAQEARPDEAALLEEYRQLDAEFGERERAWFDEVPKAEDGSLRPTAEQWAAFPQNSYAPRFLELGRRAGATEAGVRALLKALQYPSALPRAPGAPTPTLEVGELLVERFPDSPILARAMYRLGGLRWQAGSDAAEALLRSLLERSTSDAVKSGATFELAQVLMEPVYPPDIGSSSSPVPRADTAPARALLESLQRDWPDSDAAQQAKGFLFELDHLQVGMVAPDVEATDQDGVAFKLSDYRGKVVLLVFWGFW